jgi:hypothetical protein
MACTAPWTQPMTFIELFILKLVGRLEELFKLLPDRLREIAHVFKACSEC